MDVCDADGPFDELDAVVLGNVRRLWSVADPVPVDLVDQVLFALDVADLDVEFLRCGNRLGLAAARGDEQTRLITFDGSTLTIMVNITANADGTARVDGWITPAACHPVELRTSAGELSSASDDGGRFSFDSVARGLTQLLVRAGGGVTTPTIVL